ncbi:MAG: hypothetical protein ABI255_02535 [Microbacteriaceae bacterium]
MNTELTQTQRRSPVTSAASTANRRSRAPNFLERLALLVGIALIIWGHRRSTVRNGREALIRRHQVRTERDARESAYRRRLSLPWPRS